MQGNQFCRLWAATRMHLHNSQTFLPRYTMIIKSTIKNNYLFSYSNSVVLKNLKYLTPPPPISFPDRAHVPFGQHQDTELWNSQFPETKILGLPASRRMRGLV